MSFQMSPGVEVREVDLTNIIPAVSTSIGGFAGYFRWGPVSEIQLVSSEKDLANMFGKPDSFTAESFFTAGGFLKYGNALKVVRANNAVLKNAAVLGSGVSSPVIRNAAEWETFGSKASYSWIARYPGALGNSLDVIVYDDVEYSSPTPGDLNLTGFFNGAPADPEVHIAVVDREGLITGTANTVLETFAYVSTLPGAKKEDGSTNYLPEVIERYSQYVYVGTDSVSTRVYAKFSTTSLGVFDGYFEEATPGEWVNVDNNPSNSGDFGINFRSAGTLGAGWYLYEIAAGPTGVAWAFSNAETLGVRIPTSVSDWIVGTEGGASRKATMISMNAANWDLAGTWTLTGGVDISTVTAGDITNALDMFVDSETVDVNLLFTIADADGSDVLAEKLIEIAEGRKDAVAFVSPPNADTVNIASATALTNVLTWANGLSSSSYVSIAQTAFYVYDKYNDVYRWIGSSGHTAGLCANTDMVADAWYSPAGYSRGIIRGVVKVAFNPTKAQRDELYKARVNSIVSFPGQGILLYGDKTGLSRPSAFDRINVRRLFIVLEKAIATAAKYQLFEFNDVFTRAQFRNMTEPFLREVQGRRGLSEFFVVCDESNNTGDVIDRNEFVADIYIKPARSINFIRLNFVATRTDVSFEEIIGLSA